MTKILQKPKNYQNNPKTRGVQNFTGIDLTDRRQRHSPDCSTDRMNWGWHSDFALHSNAGAVKSSDWEIWNSAVAKPNRYRICFAVLFLFFNFNEADKTTSYVWVLLINKKKRQNDAFYARLSDSQGYISLYVSLSIF